jgi:hypothetical protein
MKRTPTVPPPSAETAVETEEQQTLYVMPDEPGGPKEYRPNKLPSGRIDQKCSACTTFSTIYVDEPDTYDEKARKDLFIARGWLFTPAPLCRWCVRSQLRNSSKRKV